MNNHLVSQIGKFKMLALEILLTSNQHYTDEFLESRYIQKHLGIDRHLDLSRLNLNTIPIRAIEDINP